MSYLILGASSGLGKELAYILAKHSNNLIIISRDERDLKAIKSDLENKFKINVKYFVVDASSFDEIKNLDTLMYDRFVKCEGSLRFKKK